MLHDGRQVQVSTRLSQSCSAPPAWLAWRTPARPRRPPSPLHLVARRRTCHRGLAAPGTFRAALALGQARTAHSTGIHERALRHTPWASGSHASASKVLAVRDQPLTDPPSWRRRTEPSRSHLARWPGAAGWPVRWELRPAQAQAPTAPFSCSTPIHDIRWAAAHARRGVVGLARRPGLENTSRGAARRRRSIRTYLTVAQRPLARVPSSGHRPLGGRQRRHGFDAF